MAKQERKQGPAIKRGLVTDTSYLNQPPGALTFALNTVNESEVGDSGWRVNEQSNEPCYTLPNGYIPIGQIYIGKNETIIFSVSQDEQLNEIGITNANCEYTTLVNHYLGFKLSNQISGTYRLRRGCERVLYFTTPRPMVFNIDKPGDFKTEIGGNNFWDIDKFSLFKTYSKIPFFESIEVIENGALQPGAYNASIQYLDSDLNPTEWITTCEPIKIYNDSTSRNYEDINGSTSIVDNITNYGLTNKSIKFDFSNLDEDYPLYRVAIIESNTGTGLVSAVNFSAPISTKNTTFTYSGIESIVTVGVEEDIIAFNNIISAAEFVEQIENRLTLGKTKGVQINFCRLQKYASRIQAQLSLSEIVLNQIGPSNPKTEDVNFIGTGYMPGEIYSFGIVYIFEDSSLSPVFHIPGKADGYSSAMSSDNKCQDIKYQDLSCEGDYWGLDSQGVELKDTPLRHHRFPTRLEVLEPLYSQTKVLDPFYLNNLLLNVSGGLVTAGTTITYRVTFTVEGSLQQSTEYSFLTADYDPLVGIDRNVIKSRNNIVIDSIEEKIDAGAYVNVVGIVAPSGLTYVGSVVSQIANNDVDIFTSKIMGIKFEGIDIPSQDDTNETPIVGYYIVRNERTEGQKTVLDTGVITPMLIQDKGYVAHAHIFPTLADKSIIDKDIFGLIHPEHLFNGREYKNATSVLQQGQFVISGDKAYSSVLTQDVGAGTSYNPEIHKSSSADYDGFSLHTLTRETAVAWNSDEQEIILDPFNKGEIFYLNTLNSKTIKDTDDLPQEVYNVSGDNKVGIIKTDNDLSKPGIVYDKLPYVVLNRTLANPYSTFRTLPYFKDVRNPIMFDTTDTNPETNGTNTIVRNGDSYIVPIKYHSAVFVNYRLADRKGKSGTWKIILGAILVVAGVLITVGTLGGGAAVGIAVAGLGVSQIASGIETNKISKVYQEAYEAGLRETIADDDTEAVFGNEGTGTKPVSDDEMQWVSDVVTNLWFETGVNVALRNTTSIAISDFLYAPTNLGVTGIYDGTPAPAPVKPLDHYILEKLTTIDTDNEDGRLYKGYAGAELYLLSRDYIRTNKQKIFFALGLEYDCCSDCVEDFPHREYYSEQSFQEELIDNYRVFLPNNYRDIEGEKGVITDVFRIQNNLYIHTEGALWHLPQNIQERVTGDIVSFIGTGSFFSVPPRKITDTDKESAGTSHNWARMKTANGTFFVSADEGKVFLFNGEFLNPITTGNENWFKHNLPVTADYDYLISAGVPYPYKNNPSNPFGTGFISAYDTHKERFILTKKDFKFSNRIIGGDDYRVCVNNGEFIIFDNYSETIAQRKLDGWSYLGIEDCRMKFNKVGIVDVTEERTVITYIPNKADVWVALDMTPSLSDTDRLNIKNAALQWELDYRTQLGWEGNLNFFEYTSGEESERWMKTLERILLDPYYTGTNINTLDIVLMSFVVEAYDVYNSIGTTLNIAAPTATYTSDFNSFKTYFAQLNSFIGVNYPILMTVGSDIGKSNAFLQHSLASYYGVPLTLLEASEVVINPGLTNQGNLAIRDSLVGVNPYDDGGLEMYNWQGVWDRFSNSVDPVITPEKFAEDLNTVLKQESVTETIIVIIPTETTIIEYVEGVTVAEPIDYDLSWTMSYSLKDNEWVSWHSYLPNFYLYRLQEFYSWRNGDNSIYEHNKDNHYQTFYGERFPHIIEYVDNKKPRETKMWDYLSIQSHATRFNEEFQEDVDVDVTFNKLIAYTSKQTTGLQALVPKVDGLGYLEKQVTNSVNTIPIDRNERDWTINDLRDIRSDYGEPIFRKDNLSLKTEYYIDKVLNNSALDYSKDWYDLQSFRDKYLVVRLIFDNFENTRLVTNFTEEMDYKSFR